MVTRLTYPASSGAVAPASGDEERPAVAVRPFADLRPEPRSVVVKVWDARRDFDVETPDDVPGWVTGALRVELERLGVRVAEVAGPVAVPVVGGDVTEVRCDATVPSWSGRVAIRAWVEKGGERALDRTYQGSGRRGGMWRATAEVYERCLADALRDAATRVAADVRTVALGGAPPPVSVEPPARERTGAARAGLVALGVVLGEGIILGYSALAAEAPKAVGWTMVALTPVAAGSGEAEGVAAHFTAVGGILAIGLYDALVLGSDRYSHGQRFWRNVAAWHAVVAGAAVASWIEGPAAEGADEPKLGLGVGLGAGRPVLLLGGRF